MCVLKGELELKVAFSAGLTDSGSVGPFDEEMTLIFSKIITNVGGAYNQTAGDVYLSWIDIQVDRQCHVSSSVLVDYSFKPSLLLVVLTLPCSVSVRCVNSALLCVCQVC